MVEIRSADCTLHGISCVAYRSLDTGFLLKCFWLGYESLHFLVLTLFYL